jgi:hypothetical protein
MSKCSPEAKDQIYSMTRFFGAAVCASALTTYFAKGAMAEELFNKLIAVSQIGFAALQFLVAAPMSVRLPNAPILAAPGLISRLAEAYGTCAPAKSTSTLSTRRSHPPPTRSTAPSISRLQPWRSRQSCRHYMHKNLNFQVCVNRRSIPEAGVLASRASDVVCSRRMLPRPVRYPSAAPQPDPRARPSCLLSVSRRSGEMFPVTRDSA